MTGPPCRWCGRTTTNRIDILEGYCTCCGGAFLPKGCEHRPVEVDVELPAFEPT